MRAKKDVQRMLWNRAHLKALKLAALVSVGINWVDPQITLEIAKWAIKIVVKDVNNLLSKFNNNEIGLDNEEHQQLEKMIVALKHYYIKPWTELRSYTGVKRPDLYNAKIINYAYLHKKLANDPVFKKDKFGATASVKRTIQTMIERGDLTELGKTELVKNYNTQSRCFMVSNLEVIGL